MKKKKKKLSMYALIVLRERKGLDAYDDSKDEEILKMSDSEKVKEIMTWEYGTLEHYYRFIDILANATGREMKDVEDSIFNNNNNK